MCCGSGRYIMPRVTEVLRYYTNYDQVPGYVLENAAARGTRVHALCASLCEGAWIPDGMVGQEDLGYVLSFRDWLDSEPKKFIFVEKRFTHPRYGYSGGIDSLIKLPTGDEYIVDLKTSSAPQKTYPLQMAAYKELLESNGHQVKGALLVYLSKTGKAPKIVVYENLEEEKWIFLQALDVYNYFNREKEDGPKSRRAKTARNECVPKSASDNERAGLHTKGR